MLNLNNTPVSNHVLKINVGFLLHQPIGYSRDMDFDIPAAVAVADDVQISNLRGSLRMTRTKRGILVQGDLQVNYQAQCTRCLEPIMLQLNLPVEELFVYPPTPKAEFVVHDDGILNLVPLLREEIILQTPIRVLCVASCRGLCPKCGENLNNNTCACEQDEIDPRFAILQHLQLGD
jgi:uncharacterized protein